MDPDIVVTPGSLAALIGAPPLAFATQDAVIGALLVALGVGVGMVIGPSALRLLRRRRGAGTPPRDEAARRRMRPSAAGLADDPIVAALGVRDDETARARRRRRPIGTGLHTPPEDVPPPT